MTPGRRPPLSDALERALGTAVAALEPVAGGDLNDAHRARLADGRTLFVKTGTGGYAAEAAGLRWLAEARALPVAEVVAVEDDAFLALAWIDRGRLDAGGEEELGRGLAALHAAGAPAHGHTPDGGPLRLGPLTVPSAPGATWAEVHAHQRLAPLLRAARDRGAVDAAGAAAVERVIARIDDLAGPPEPPARLHGDLWWGNVLAGAGGRAHLVDPAAHGGHREVDLAMLALFGGLAPRARAAYEEAAPLAAGHAGRVALWQLFPLLVHAVLFGGGYGASAARAATALA
ncbi:MAG TPA: fructosamine kinase family protein [Baekduia sp.]|nr:fructosamine kinase family protein [Baekduia sp.]